MEPQNPGPTNTICLSEAPPPRREAFLAAHPASPPRDESVPACFHCGLPCLSTCLRHKDHAFCCQGCLAVFTLLTANGLDAYYRLNQEAGLRPDPVRHRFECLDEPATRERLTDYSDEHQTRVRFRIPVIHCIACVWLLENLFRLNPGIGRSEVNFARRELSLTFDPARLRLGEVASLLASLGYEPDLTMADLSGPGAAALPRRWWLPLGVAGFAFGNTMFLSLPSYFGLNRIEDPAFARVFGWYSFALALPVLLYSARDYWRAAWNSVRHRRMRIEVPIALGLAALFGQSTHHLLTGTGEGYFDSFSGLVFFLLIGKAFQEKTYQRLSFDRDYRSFFPLSVTRKQGGGEERVVLNSLEVGDRMVIRNGELIPADARLVEGPALIDYSFVTGESVPVSKAPEERLYAGGRQVGGAIEARVVKPVSQSYLASLWNHEAFRKRSEGAFMMAYNLFKTARSGRFVPDVQAQAIPFRQQTPPAAGHAHWHRWLESRAVLFTVLSFVAILIGGLVEIVPLYLIKENVPTISSVKPYSPLEVLGRDLYIREGCVGCHSQMIRPFRSETERYGDYSKAGEFSYDHPFLWGSKRSGPDLHRQGGKYPDAWHYNHMEDPRSTSPGSIMPRYPWLLTQELDTASLPSRIRALRKVGVPCPEGYEHGPAQEALDTQAAQVVDNLKEGLIETTPDREIIALIAYLQRLGTDIKGAPTNAPAQTARMELNHGGPQP